MQSRASTVRQYLAELPEERRKAVAAIRKVILENLDPDYEEGMSYGMIGYCVPHTVYPPGYHCDPKQPLPFVNVASQKQHLSVYLMSLYAAPGEEKWFRKAWTKGGRKLDMGKCCVRFRKLEDAALDVIGEAVRRWPAARYVAHYESVRPEPSAPARRGQGSRKPSRVLARKKAVKQAPSRARRDRA